jgi:hypothetical protein
MVPLYDPAACDADAVTDPPIQRKSWPPAEVVVEPPVSAPKAVDDACTLTVLKRGICPVKGKLFAPNVRFTGSVTVTVVPALAAPWMVNVAAPAVSEVMVTVAPCATFPSAKAPVLVIVNAALTLAVTFAVVDVCAKATNEIAHSANPSTRILFIMTHSSDDKWMVKIFFFICIYNTCAVRKFHKR